MREYARISPTFWTGETGKALCARGSEGALMALYLISAPLSNMLGLFYQPLLYAAHETGLGVEGASKGLMDCVEVGFCKYDHRTQVVWVIEMASWQIAEELKELDKRCSGIQRDYNALPENPFLGEWFDRYRSAFHLTKRRGIEAPSKQGAGKEQARSRQGAGKEQPPVSPPSPNGHDLLGEAPAIPSSPVVEAVIAAYHSRLPGCQRVNVVSPKRTKRILAADKLARSVCKQQGWAYHAQKFWDSYFAQCANDPWMRGERPNPNNPSWKQNIGVLLEEDRFAKIMDEAIDLMRADA